MASAKRRIAGRGRARLARRSSRGSVLEPAPDPSRRPVGRGRKVGLTEDLAAVTGERGVRACSKLAHDRTAYMATGRHQLTRNDTWSAISCRPSNLRIEPPRLGQTCMEIPTPNGSALAMLHDRYRRTRGRPGGRVGRTALASRSQDDHMGPFRASRRRSRLIRPVAYIRTDTSRRAQAVTR